MRGICGDRPGGSLGISISRKAAQQPDRLRLSGPSSKSDNADVVLTASISMYPLLLRTIETVPAHIEGTCIHGRLDYNEISLFDDGTLISVFRF